MLSEEIRRRTEFAAIDKSLFYPVAHLPLDRRDQWARFKRRSPDKATGAALGDFEPGLRWRCTAGTKIYRSVFDH